MKSKKSEALFKRFGHQGGRVEYTPWYLAIMGEIKPVAKAILPFRISHSDEI